MIDGNWESLPDMLCAKSYVSGAVTGQRIYIAGNGSAYLEEFNPSSNSFRQLNFMIKTVYSNPSIVAYDHNVFIFTGNY